MPGVVSDPGLRGALIGHAGEATLEIRQLRRLLYCGEWIESHALHVYLLAPDFLATRTVPSDHREAVERCLRLKCVGESLVAALGGSAKHPINIAVGGFHRVPRAYQLADLRPELEWAVEASVRSSGYVSAFDFPRFDVDYLDYEERAPAPCRCYPMNEGHVISSRGLVVPVNQYESHFSERGLGQVQRTRRAIPTDLVPCRPARPREHELASALADRSNRGRVLWDLLAQWKHIP